MTPPTTNYGPCESRMRRDERTSGDRTPRRGRSDEHAVSQPVSSLLLTYRHRPPAISGAGRRVSRPRRIPHRNGDRRPGGTHVRSVASRRPLPTDRSPTRLPSPPPMRPTTAPGTVPVHVGEAVLEPVRQCITKAVSGGYLDMSLPPNPSAGSGRRTDAEALI